MGAWADPVPPQLQIVLQMAALQAPARFVCPSPTSEAERALPLKLHDLPGNGACQISDCAKELQLPSVLPH